MNRILTVISLLLPFGLSGQQLPQRSPFGDYNFVWNPAMTSVYDYADFGASYRQDWMGFDDAPTTMILHGQYPFQDYNMSLGGFFMHDRIHPLKTNALALTYSYKLEPGFGDGDQLSFGIMGVMYHYFVDGMSILVNDDDDTLLPTGENISFKPNVGAGFFYTSNREKDESSFYFGAGFNQLLPSDIVFQESAALANFKRVLHGNALVGGRIMSNNQLFMEPSAWVNYAGQNLLDYNLGIKIEAPESFWAGLAYSNNQTLALQVGAILAKNFPEESSLRIGVLGTYNIGTFGQFRGLGYEFGVVYRYGQ